MKLYEWWSEQDRIRISAVASSKNEAIEMIRNARGHNELVETMIAFDEPEITECPCAVIMYEN